MCLIVKIDAKPKIAKEDITVYKRLISVHSFLQPEKYHDNEFVGKIYNVRTKGKISVEEGHCYFCTNQYDLDGQGAENKLGYKYSWVLDRAVEEIIVDDVKIISDGVIIVDYVEKLATPYQKSYVEIGKTYTSKLDKIVDSVEAGLHSFVNLSDAKLDSNNDSGVINVFVKCVIPKGSEYYEGFFGSMQSLASDKLTYVEIVE